MQLSSPVIQDAFRPWNQDDRGQTAAFSTASSCRHSSTSVQQQCLGLRADVRQHLEVTGYSPTFLFVILGDVVRIIHEMKKKD